MKERIFFFFFSLLKYRFPIRFNELLRKSFIYFRLVEKINANVLILNVLCREYSRNIFFFFAIFGRNNTNVGNINTLTLLLRRIFFFFFFHFDTINDYDQIFTELFFFRSSFFFFNFCILSRQKILNF